MVEPVAWTDVAAMLAAFERSGFERLDLRLGAVRVAASRPARSETDAPVAEGTIVTIPAPRIGVFQAAHESGSAPLVVSGDVVDEETVVGLIRIRRQVIAVPAGRSGTVASLLVEDGEFVEYGQPLLRLRAQGAAAGAGR